MLNLDLKPLNWLATIASGLWAGLLVPTNAEAALSTTSAAIGAVVVAALVLASLIAGVVTVILWVAVRRKAAVVEEVASELRKDLENAQDILRVAPIPYAILDNNTLSLRVSPGFCAFMGWHMEPTSLDTLASHFIESDATVLKGHCLEEEEHAGQRVAVLRENNGGRRLFVMIASLSRETSLKVLWFNNEVQQQNLDSYKDHNYELMQVEHSRFTKILDSLPMPIWWRTTDLSLEWVNQAHRIAVKGDKFSYSPTSELELVRNISEKEARALAKRAVSKKTPQSEKRWLDVDGESRSFELVEIPLKCGEVVGFGHDITERDSAVWGLSRYSEASIEIFNRLQSGVAIFDSNRSLIFYNETYLRLWEFDKNWLSQQPKHDEIIESLRQRRLLPEQVDFPAYRDNILGYYTSLISPLEELEVRPDGRTVRSVVSPHPPGGILIINHDVTDQLEIKRSKNTSEAVQKIIIDQLQEGVAVFGGDGRLKLFNTRFSKIWDLPIEFLQEQPHVTKVLEACRYLLQKDSGNDTGWRYLSDRIIEHVLGRKQHIGRVNFSDGRTISYSGMPLPDGNIVYIYFNLTLEP